MKKFLLIFVIIFLSLIFPWYFHYWDRFSNLQEDNKKAILESFKPDSDGDGISNFANKALKEDFKKITNLTTEEKNFLEFWTVEYIKFKRILVLSKNREEYLKNARIHYKMFRCSNLFLSKLGSKNNYSFILEKEYETDDFENIQYTLEKNNFRFLSFDEIYEIQNPKMNLIKCDDLKKELKL